MPTLIRDGQTLVYGASGTGPATVVLAHNLMARRGSFAAVAGALAGRARVLSVDLRAHGDSVPTRAGFTVMALAEDLAAVLDAEGVDRALLVGTSLGASAAMWLASTQPQRVSGLVLVSATPYAATGLDRVRFAALAAVLRGLGPRLVLPAIVGQLLGASYRGRADAVAEVERWIRATPRGELVRAVQAWVGRPALLDRLAAIAAPTVVVAGAEDTACPREFMARLAAGIRGARLEVIVGAGHTVQLEQPAALTGVIAALLDRVSG